MRKGKKWYIATGAGLGMILSYPIWNAGIGLVLGAAVGSIIFASTKGKNKSSTP
jgi:multidrug transporter EmrE-like cation transporter